MVSYFIFWLKAAYKKINRIKLQLPFFFLICFFYKYLLFFLVDYVKNTGTNDQEGVNWKITKGGRLENYQGAKGAKNLHRGALPLLHHSYSPPLSEQFQKMISGPRPPSIKKFTVFLFFFKVFSYLFFHCAFVQLGQVAALCCDQDMRPCAAARIRGPALRLGYSDLRCGHGSRGR